MIFVRFSSSRQAGLSSFASKRRAFAHLVFPATLMGSTPAPSDPGPAAPVGKLILLRHGETEWNKTGRLQGQLDTQLNEAGLEQAKTVAKLLWYFKIVDKVDAVVSSDLSRASQTADFIAEYCPSAQRLQDPGLREIHAGILEGKFLTEIAEERKALTGAWQSGDYDACYPGGESVNDAMKRGVAALQRAAGLGETVVVVAHGGLIKWSAIRIEEEAGMAQANLEEMRKAPLRNCCVSVLSYDPSQNIFRGEKWFEDLLTKETLDDTG